MKDLDFNFIGGLVVLVLSLAFMSGCAGMLKGEKDVLTDTGIAYATLKFIDRSSDPTKRAGEVFSIIDEVLSLDFEDVSVLARELETAVRDRVDWSSLDDAEILLVDSLISLVRAELEERIDTYQAPDALLSVRQVLETIRDAAQIKASI